MAMYNNGFPVTYPQYQQYQAYQQPYQMQNQQQLQNPQQMNSGIIWVSGEAGARGYMVAPNTTVQLWDSDAQVIFLKSADASGMPSMKILDYTIRETPQNGPVTAQNQEKLNIKDYVTKAEFDDLKAQFEAFTAKRTVKPTKKEEVGNE